MELNQLLLEVRTNLTSPIRSNPAVPKLPESLSSIAPIDLNHAIVEAVKLLVKNRGMFFQSISGTEMDEKIGKAIDWLYGPINRSSLLLQGVPGTGKTTILLAIYNVFMAANASMSFTSATALFDAFAVQNAGVSWAYEEYKRMNRLCIDDLGAEPGRCLLYGVEYTPIQTLLTYRYDKQLPTIITTNLSDSMIRERYGERITDRFAEMCTILRFSGQSFRNNKQP